MRKIPVLHYRDPTTRDWVEIGTVGAPGKDGPQGPQGVRGSVFHGSYPTASAFPPIDGVNVLPGDYAYALDDGYMYQVGGGSPYDDTVLLANPVIYLPLDSTTQFVDLSGNGHSATLHGTILAGQGLPSGDSTIRFDGATGYVEVPDHPALSVATTGILTIEAWIAPEVLEQPNDEGEGYVHWMGKGVSGQHEWACRMYSYTTTSGRPNRISGYAYNLTGGLGIGSYFQDAVTANQWIHYCLVINSAVRTQAMPLGYVVIYKNGVERDRDSLDQPGLASITPTNGTAPMRIGTRDFASWFSGDIAKVALYDYELSAATILSHYEEMQP